MEAVYNPATGEVIAQVPLSTKGDVEQAVLAANEAFKSWSKTAVPKRARILFKYQQLLVDNWEELAKLITIENGKAITRLTVRFFVVLSAWSLQRVLLH